MILELADIRIKPGAQVAFDAAIQKDIDSVIANAKGFMGYRVNRGIESPQRSILMIFWQTLENHTVNFRLSPAFQERRAIVGPYFSGPPVVEHFTLLAESVLTESMLPDSVGDRNMAHRRSRACGGTRI